MIIKRTRIGRKHRRSSRLIGLMVKVLVAYITDARAESLREVAAVAAMSGDVIDSPHLDRHASEGEKVREIGCRNLNGATIADWQADMAACAMQSTAFDPSEHIVVSLAQVRSTDASSGRSRRRLDSE